MIIITDGYPTLEAEQMLPEAYQSIDEDITVSTEEAPEKIPGAYESNPVW